MTIRFKLIMAAIAIVVVANLFHTLLAVDYFEQRWLDDVQNRVRLDLNSARASYDNYLLGMSQFLEGVAVDRDLARELGKTPEKTPSEASRARLLRGPLRRSKWTSDRDRCQGERWSTVVRIPDKHGDSLAENPLVAEAIRQKRPVTGSLCSRRGTRPRRPETGRKSPYRGGSHGGQSHDRRQGSRRRYDCRRRCSAPGRRRSDCWACFTAATCLIAATPSSIRSARRFFLAGGF